MNICINCQYKLSGVYCSHCGIKNNYIAPCNHKEERTSQSYTLFLMDNDYNYHNKKDYCNYCLEYYQHICMYCNHSNFNNKKQVARHCMNHAFLAKR